jgi:hypothetical protein
MSNTRALLVAGLLCLSTTPAGAQGGIQLQGIADLELWATDSTSNLLTRNKGNPGGVFRLQMWSAVEPWLGVFLFAQARAEGGNARAFEDRGIHTVLEQGGLRVARDPRLVVNVGRMFHPVGAFAARIFSTRNPLIGIPDGYSPVYPGGAMVSGEVERFDYRGAFVMQPLTHRDYVPRAGQALRPAVGFGVRPFTGLRIGASATIGPYLNRDITDAQLASREWHAYRQRIIAGDVQYGVGHFDLRAEYAWSDFEVPRSGRIDGHTEYVEARYTVTPRLFVAARAEVNNYPFIRPRNEAEWTSRRTEFKDWEAGAGLRLTESTLLKASYRADDWVQTAANANFVRPGGRALAVQLSQSFDVMDWVEKARR